MIPFIDIHTHKVPAQSKNDIISLVNIIYPNIPKSHHEILSLHPWSLPESENEAIKYLETNYTQGQLLGEIGLDKLSKTSWEKQVQMFELALGFAVANKLPGITVHSVKSHQECLKYINKLGFRGAIIFHNFFSSLEETKSILRRENTFISLGKLLHTPKSKLYSHLKELPLNRIFLETDDADTTIEEQYKLFCFLTEHGLDHVKKVCYDSFILIHKGSS